MTTRIKVSTHCDDSTEVTIETMELGNPKAKETKIIQDGEEYELVVYDDLEIRVKEVKKA